MAKTRKCWGRTPTFRRCRQALKNKRFCKRHRYQIIAWPFAGMTTFGLLVGLYQDFWVSMLFPKDLSSQVAALVEETRNSVKLECAATNSRIKVASHSVFTGKQKIKQMVPEQASDLEDQLHAQLDLGLTETDQIRIRAALGYLWNYTDKHELTLRKISSFDVDEAWRLTSTGKLPVSDASYLAEALANAAFFAGSWDLAAEQYRQILQHNSMHVASRLDLGVVLLSLGRADEAAAELDIVIDQLDKLSMKPNASSRQVCLLKNAFVSRSAAALELDMPEEAMSDAEKVLSRFDSENAKALCNLANAFEQLGRLQEAEDSYRRSIDADEELPQPRIGLAFLLAEQDQVPEARLHLSKCLEILPDDAVAHYNFGTLCLEMMDYDAAEESLRRSVELDPTAPRAWVNLANVLSKTSRLEDSIKLYRRAIDADPTFAHAHRVLAQRLVDLNRPQEAVAALTNGINYIPDSAALYYRLGNLLAESNGSKGALDAFISASLLDPTYGRALNNAGVQLQLLGRFEEALIYYERAANATPDLHQPYLGMAQLHRKLSDLESAYQALSRGIQRQLGNDSLFIQRAQVNEELGNLDEAIIDYGRAISLRRIEYEQRTETQTAARLTMVLNDRGTFFDDSGDHESALHDYTSAISLLDGKLADDDPLKYTMYLSHAFQNRGRTNSETGNIRAAVDDYKQAAELREHLHSNGYPGSASLFAESIEALRQSAQQVNDKQLVEWATLKLGILTESSS